MLIDREGQNAIQLTDLRNELMPEISRPLDYCFPRAASLSFDYARLYYGLDCVNDNGEQRALVYSVSLEGNNNRLEANLSVIYSNDFSQQIQGIVARETGVYVAVSSQTMLNAHIFDGWRILQITQPEITHTLYENFFDNSLSRALHAFVPSPDGNSFALSGYDNYAGATDSYLAIVDTNGMQSPTGYTLQQHHICEINWQNNGDLILTDHSNFSCSPFEPSGEQLRFNTETGDFTVMNTPPGAIWILDPVIMPSISPSP